MSRETDRILKEQAIANAKLDKVVEGLSMLLGEKNCRVDIYLHFPETGAGLERIEAKLDTIITKENQQMAAIDDLEREVSEQTTVISSAVTLLQELKRMLDEAIASGSMERVAAVAAQLDSHSQALAEAVAANTPTPPPTP